ncbi:MAG TPA: hypothetical protein VEA59_03215 [Patescibacteria group bacterium]|nr:hypothetical protein [Patescibacteria group bacterium]
MKKYILSSFVLFSFFVSTASAYYSFEERIQSPTIDSYQQQIVILSNVKVKVAFRPLNFDAKGKKWNYRVDWEVQGISQQTGSMCINGKKFVANFANQDDANVAGGYSWTGYTLKPKARYKVTVYEKPNCKGKLLLNKSFTVLAKPQ